MKREDLYTTTELLLFDILQELKQLNKPEKPIEKPIEEPIPDNYCQYCGKVHPNTGLAKACEKRNKKEGVKNG